MYVFIDFETFYENKVYTLKSMSMEAYVRDPRFETQLLGVAIDDGPVHMFEAWQIPEILNALPLENPNVWTFAQNAKFDVFILNEIYNKKVYNPICTRAMARWTGVSRMTRESQAALCEFLGTGTKGTFIESMSGRRLSDLTPEEAKAYKDYCATDVIDLRSNAYAMLPKMTDEAMEFISMTTKMYTDPVFQIDVPLLEHYYQKLSDAHERSRESLMHLFKFEDTESFLKALRSKPKFKQMLESIGGVCPMKISEKKSATRKKQLEEELGREPTEDEYTIWEPALAKTDLGFIELQGSDDENIAALATARAENNSSAAMSRTITFLDIGRRGMLAVPLEPFQAWTSRYTGGSRIENVQSDGVNLQNLAKRKGDKTIRFSITARPGEQLVGGDSSQVEARMGAYVGRQDDLLIDFATGGDPYSDVGGKMFNEDPAVVYYWAKGEGKQQGLDKDTIKYYTFIRNVGKEFILSGQYGAGYLKMGLRLLQQKLKLGATDEEHYEKAKEFHAIYNARYPMLGAQRKQCDMIIRDLYFGGSGEFGGPNHNLFKYTANYSVFGHKTPAIIFPNGYPLIYPNLRQEQDEDGRNKFVYDQFAKGRRTPKYIYGGLLFNNITQGLSFAALMWQALRINREFPVKLNVHDEWVSVCKEHEVEACKAVYAKWLRTAPWWCEGVPFDCEIHSGRTYGEI